MPAGPRRSSIEGEKLADIIRNALQDGSGAGNAHYLYPDAWAAIDTLAEAASLTFNPKPKSKPFLAATTDIGSGIVSCNVCQEVLLEDERHWH